jgi:hypothetical protein
VGRVATFYKCGDCKTVTFWGVVGIVVVSLLLTFTSYCLDKHFFEDEKLEKLKEENEILMKAIDEKNLEILKLKGQPESGSECHECFPKDQP